LLGKYFPDADDDEVADDEADGLGLLVRSLAVIVSDEGLCLAVDNVDNVEPDGTDVILTSVPEMNEKIKNKIPKSSDK
jgi:hypothetical protein